MGNCLGLCEFIRTPDRMKGLRRRIRIFLSLPETNRQPWSRHGNPTQISAERCWKRIESVNVLDEPTEDVKLEFDLGEEIGRGQFGVIRLCKSKRTGEQFACKSIAKGRLCSQKELDCVLREIEIMKQLKGHPRIVELKAVYEDCTWIHLVIELCEGGELFDNIVKEKVYSEKDAAETCRNLMEAVQYCHSHGVIHRDLKPENILLVSKASHSEIKLVDFGLAVNFEPGDKFSGRAGSAYYIAPEVLKGEYGEQVDVWSAGVILYILLSGVPPFWDSTEEGILDAIKYGHLDLVSDPWPSISKPAKHLIRGMLCPDIKNRFSPEEVLSQEWIVKHTQASKSERLSSDLQQDSKVPWPWSSSHCTSVPSSFPNFSFGSSEVGKHAAQTASHERITMGNGEHNPPFQNSALKASADGGSLSLRKWTSFTGLAEKVPHELSGTSVSTVGKYMFSIPRAISSQLQTPNGRQSKFPNSKETQIVDLIEKKIKVVHDTENEIRIGWKLVKEVEARLPLQSNKLLWSPCSTAIHVQAQAQLVC